MVEKGIRLLPTWGRAGATARIEEIIMGIVLVTLGPVCDIYRYVRF